MKIAARSASTMARPAEPLKPVSQASRCERARHVFALMLVGARHHEAVEAAALRARRAARPGAPPARARRRARHRPAPALAPGGERPGQFGICARDRPVRPIPGRPGPRARRPRRASGQSRAEGSGFRPRWRSRWRTSSGAELMSAGPYAAVRERQSEQYSCSRECEMRNLDALMRRDAYQSFQAFTYRCNSRLYICFSAAQHRLPRRTIRSRP